MRAAGGAIAACLAAGVFLGAAEAPARAAEGRGGEPVYENDFERAAGEEWSSEKRSRTPKGDRGFLGEFVKEAVTLALDDLPEHRYVRVSFDLFVIGTWDGNHREWGPDVWQVSVDGGPVILRTSFGYRAVHYVQSFPGDYPTDESPMETGAAEKHTLGYAAKGRHADSVYKMSFTFPHRGRALKLDFECEGNVTNAQDESWGLDNVRVEVLGDAAERKYTEEQLEAFWSDLASDDGETAFEARWALAVGGEAAEEHLRKKLANTPEPGEVGRERIAELIEALDADEWTTRERASRELARIGPKAKAALMTAARSSDSIEVRLRAKAILEKIGGPATDPTDKRRVRAARTMALLTWQRGENGP
jgi:hypothetical protein